MFSRLSRLCHRSVDHAGLNLRRYRNSTIPGQEQDVPTTEKIPKKEKGAPLIVCKRQEFNFFKGKTFSKFEAIPIASQGWHHSKSAGDHFTILPDYEDEDNHEALSEKRSDFGGFGLHSKLIECLSSQNIYEPSDIQSLAIPQILAEQHTKISSETGSGKTLAYLLPLLTQIYRWKSLHINSDRRPNSPYGLIITPSRELADQIGKVAKAFGKDLGIKIRVITGGRTKRISTNPTVGEIDLLIGSFGVISKMTTTRIYKLNFVRHLVLDEAHALFDVTFDEKLSIFLRRISFGCGDAPDDTGFPNACQMTLVSATKGAKLPEYMASVVNESLLNEITTSNYHRVMVPQKFMRIAAIDKPMTLLKLVKPKAAKKHQFIVFSNDNSTCDWIFLFLEEFDIRVTHLNGEMPMLVRKGKFSSFQRGDYAVLSATNAGARGLDTVNVNNVINYDFPMETADYIHRCGRTGRLGTSGECRVTNLISRRLEIELTQKIERAARRRRPLPIFNMLDEAANREENAEKKDPKSTRKRRKSERGRPAKSRAKRQMTSANVRGSRA